MAKKYYFISNISNYNGSLEETRKRYENLKRQLTKESTFHKDKIQEYYVEVFIRPDGQLMMI